MYLISLNCIHLKMVKMEILCYRYFNIHAEEGKKKMPPLVVPPGPELLTQKGSRGFPWREWGRGGGSDAPTRDGAHGAQPQTPAGPEHEPRAPRCPADARPRPAGAAKQGARDRAGAGLKTAAWTSSQPALRLG